MFIVVLTAERRQPDGFLMAVPAYVETHDGPAKAIQAGRALESSGAVFIFRLQDGRCRRIYKTTIGVRMPDDEEILQADGEDAPPPAPKAQTATGVFKKALQRARR